ncbi:PilZ domain-containing protein [Hoeflea sp. Naph1]|uniref:PilZ domain-containing protein n=1 Tax=Hoeflea sp. Naph1 TaxID=3388653 RepID=UPI00398FDA00
MIEDDVSKEGHYLTRVGGAERRAHHRRATNAPGKVYYLRRGVRGYTSQPCKMLDLSESGCLISVGLSDQVPEHLYLVLDGLPAKISCAVIARSESRLHIKFSAEMTTEVVDRIARVKFSPRKTTSDS